VRLGAIDGRINLIQQRKHRSIGRGHGQEQQPATLQEVYGLWILSEMPNSRGHINIIYYTLNTQLTHGVSIHELVCDNL
jgi:hypothetical protein